MHLSAGTTTVVDWERAARCEDFRTEDGEEFAEWFRISGIHGQILYTSEMIGRAMDRLEKYE